VFEAILLGVLQGITEFLPISSDGHLAIGLHLFGWEHTGRLAFVVAVHLGSLGAVLIFSRREIVAMLTTRRRLLLVTILATLPVAIVGLLLKDAIEAVSANLYVVGACLFATAGLLAFGRGRDTGTGEPADLSWAKAIGIGFAQAAAILPGLSRSGSTLAASLLAGLERDRALRFVFLLAVPAISGAGIVMAFDGEGFGGVPVSKLVVGAAASFVTSLLAMAAMVRVVAKRRLGWFAVYCAVAGCFAFFLAIR
jgi:undecaprenyl-diphosphatase